MKLTAESTVINDDKLNTNIDNAQSTANSAKQVADNTAQYFWFTSSGSDTGAHISEKTQEQFVANPSGGNLLARSTGIAVREGTTELARFSADGAQIGADDTYHTSITPDSIEMVDENAGQLWTVKASGTETTRTQTFLSAIATTRAVSKYATINITDWSSVQLTFTGKRTGSANVTETRTVSASTTSLSTVSMFGAISVTFSFSTSDNKKYMSMHATVMAYGSSGRNALDVTRTITSELPKLNFYGNNNVLWEKPSGSTVYPLLNEIITLSEPISAQPSGIVLLWGYGGSKNKVVTQYVPKHCAINSGFSELPSGLICYQNMVYPAFKTMYIVSDTQLRGADSNQTDGVTYHNNLNYYNSEWQLVAVCGI